MVACPFCGLSKKLVFDPESVAIVCARLAGGCGAIGPTPEYAPFEIDPDDYDAWETKAIKVWNDRKPGR